MTEQQAKELIEAVKYANHSADWFYGIASVFLFVLIVLTVLTLAKH